MDAGDSAFGTNTYTLLCLTQIGSDDRESACEVGDLDSILGWEDPLEKGMATHSSILACESPWTEKLGGLQSMGSQRVRHD